MRWAWRIGLFVMLLAGIADAPVNAGAGWRTYRNAKFGYELSYPPDLEYTAYGDGASGVLKGARTGHRLVEFEVWPPGECPRQLAPTSAREVGIERAKTVTQADGPDGSSHCGDLVTVRESVSPKGVKIYEVELTCVRESYGLHDDTEEAGQPPTPVEPEITVEGTKGPTYFADISPTWKKRVLLADPIGVDPRMPPATAPAIDLSLLRAILNTLTTLPTSKPAGVCIEELQPRGVSIGVPSK